MELDTTLERGKRDLFLRAGAGLGLPAAGLVYWLVLGAAGYAVGPKTWGLVACVGSGLIFPLGILLGRLLGSDVLVKGPLAALAPRAVLAINLLWPLHIALYFGAIEFLPLSLAIGMGLHWPIIGWMYGSAACARHALIRVPLVSAIWFLLPAQRYTLLAFAVAAVYLVSILQMRRELANARRTPPEAAYAAG